MKYLFRMLALTIAGCGALLASEPLNPTGSESADKNASPANTDADRDWLEFQQWSQKRGRKEPGYERLSLSEKLRAQEAATVDIQQKAIEFYEKHPTDPRRWEALMTIRSAMPQFIKEIRPDYDQTKSKSSLVIDEEAKAARKKQVEAMETARSLATDVPANIRAALKSAAIMAEIKKATNPAFTGEWQTLEATIDSFYAEFPEAGEATRMILSFIRLLEKRAPASLEAYLKKAAISPNPNARIVAGSRLTLLAGERTPVEFAFTALDGAEVDAAKLRGKVVLIDFWATWCGPCIEELPKLKTLYAKYHAQGFEIVGVSLDVEADREKLIAFTAKEGITWPQWFEGKGPHSAMALKYGAQAIPMTVLLDQSGKIVSVTGAYFPPAGKNDLEDKLAKLLDATSR